jgi:hypothetical protein
MTLKKAEKEMRFVEKEMVFMQKCEELVDGNVYCRQSSLVEKLLQEEVFSWDDVDNLNEQFNARRLINGACNDCGARTEIDGDTELCKTCFKDSWEVQEIYEWWVVSDWLREKLRDKGNPILENDYGSWWGRRTTGQAIKMDGVIREIVKELLESENTGKTL